MFYIELNDKIIKSGNIEEIIIDFNDIISNLILEYNSNVTILNNSDNVGNITIIKLSVGETIISLLSNDSRLSLHHIHLLQFFIFDNKKIMMLKNTVFQDIKLNPQIILDIVTYQKHLIDPIYILTNVFNMRETHLFQSFILYLNKCIKTAENMNKLDINKIVGGFISKENRDFDKYKKLLIHYISLKKILPYKIHFNEYDSQLIPNF